MKHSTQPPSEKQCECCGRTHRKLILFGGYWLGSTCLADYILYQKASDITSAVWRGWEMRHAKVSRMLHAG